MSDLLDARTRPLEASAEDGEVVVISAEQSVAVALTAEAALATGELLKAAGLAALEQRAWRRKAPNTGRLPRDSDPV